MKKLLMAAVALTLLGGAAAHAQPQPDDRHGQGGPPPQHQGGGAPQGQVPGRFQGQPQGQPHGQPQAPPQGQGAPQGFNRNVPQAFQPRTAPGPAPAPQPGPRAGYFQGGPGLSGGPQGAPRGAPQGGYNRSPSPGPGYRPGGPGFNGAYAQGHEWRAPQSYRGRPYSFPRGYGFRVWAFGDYLPGPFFAPDYVIGDYWDYGLPAPPPGFEWLQVGSDALLVRPADGYVLDVAHDLFG